MFRSGETAPRDSHYGIQDSQIRARQKKMMPSLYMASVHGRSAQGFPSWLAHLCLSPTRIISRFRRRLVLALVFAHVWGLATMVSAASFSDHEYAVDVWEAEQGLPENTPTAMVQTPDGHLWFSSFGGLVRFDGLTFKLYDHLNTPELPGEGIVNLHLDRNGRLWISALQGLTTVKDGQWHLFWRDSGRNEGSLIRFFAESASGQVYATTFDGRILRFRDDGYEEIPRPPADPKLGFTPYVDEAGVLWVVNPQFIGKLVDGKWQEMIDARALIQEGPAAKLRWMVAGPRR